MIPEIGNVNVNNVGVTNVGVGVVGTVSNVSTNGISNVREIGIRSPQTIRVADNRIWVVNPPNATLLEPPVVVQVGTPIVNIAGCVEVHKENFKTRNRNKQLVDNDPKGNTVLCDSGAPNFIPPNYQADRLTWKTFYGEAPEAEGVKTEPPPPPQTPDTPDTPDSPEVPTKDIECPGPAQSNIRIGAVAQNKEEKVSGFELRQDPNNPQREICVTLYEPITRVEALLPDVSTVTTTATIATGATTSALLAKPLADLLLKVVKPGVKKAIGAIQKKLGKTAYRPTRQEVLTDQYRLKKGLLPTKKGKKKKLLLF